MCCFDEIMVKLCLKFEAFYVAFDEKCDFATRCFEDEIDVYIFVVDFIVDVKDEVIKYVVIVDVECCCFVVRFIDMKLNVFFVKMFLVENVEYRKRWSEIFCVKFIVFVCGECFVDGDGVYIIYS